MAFEVNPVSPNVALVVGFSFDDIYPSPFDLRIANSRTAMSRRPDGGVRKNTAQQIKKALDPENGSKTS